MKQGDLDRKNWDAEVNSVRQSIDEIREVFIPNNLAPQHQKLSIKIIVAFNGVLKQSLQQNWNGYTNRYKDFEFTIWNGEFLVKQFQEKLLNESGFSNKLRSLVRKTIIHLENRDYQLGDFVEVLKILESDFKSTKYKKTKVRVLKEMRLLVSIVLKYCEEADNLLHAVKCSEKYILRLSSMILSEKLEKEFSEVMIKGMIDHLAILKKYNTKFSFITNVRDGFSKAVADSLTYNTVVYEQLGIWCETGLMQLQMYYFAIISSDENTPEIADVYLDEARRIANESINLVNNNQIFYTPRYDDHLIEIHMLLMLLYELGLKKQAMDILYGIQKHLSESYVYSKIFPVHKDLRVVAELEADIDFRSSYDYNSSHLFTMLTEWSIVLNSPLLYESFKTIKDHIFKDINLLLWFPNKETEEKIFIENANANSGYALSGIELPESMDENKKLIEEEFEHNCFEKDFSFIKDGNWILGLIASRHFRTLVFPYYWRQLLKD